MARNVDLTGKLGLGERPTITIGDVTLVVDDTARNMIRVFEAMGDGEGMAPADVMGMASLLFEAPSAEALDALGLSFADYTAVVTTAVDLVLGADEPGNPATPATT